MNTYKCKEINLQSTVSINSFLPKIWGMRDLLRTDKQPPKWKEGDPSSRKKGREELLTELRATVTECKLSARITQETFTLIT